MAIEQLKSKDIFKTYTKLIKPTDIRDLDFGLIPFDHHLFSLELDDAFKKIHIDKD